MIKINSLPDVSWLKNCPFYFQYLLISLFLFLLDLSSVPVSLFPTVGRVMWRPWRTGFCWWETSWRQSCRPWEPQGPGTTSPSRLACSASLVSIVSTEHTHVHTHLALVMLHCDNWITIVEHWHKTGLYVMSTLLLLYNLVARNNTTWT